MKNISIYLKQILVGMAMITGLLISCTKEEEGTPVISDVRVTQKDSTIQAGEFNLTIAIQGSNLNSVVKVFFNDVEAYLNPVYVTSTNIICTIPDQAPSEITNMITLITRSGKEITYNFTVVLPDPVIDGVYNEFALPGTENKVLGDYFYVIDKVLVGQTEVEVVAVTENEITFTMPDNPALQTVTVVSGTGASVTSSFRLRETDGNLVNFDIPATGWGSDVCWGSAERVDPANSELEVISGRYTRIKQTNLAQSGWQDDWVISTCWFDFGLPVAGYTDKMFKFEHYVLEPWKAGYYEINLNTEDGKSFQYLFKPWDTEAYRTKGYSTNGWKTAYIPLSEWKTSSGEQIADISKIRDFQFIFKTPDTPIDKFYVAADNFRIVDK